MRGVDTRNETIFSHVQLDSSVPSDLPLRAIRAITEATLTRLSGAFDALYLFGRRPPLDPA
ncbi:MAG: hypothetical protein P4L71_12190 [Acetobacteraceae bacterium]|nr:hypothetical protein [Acetobacteraceae bacterium]